MVEIFRKRWNTLSIVCTEYEKQTKPSSAFVNVPQALFVNVCVGAMFPKIVSFLQLQTNPFFTISATRVRKLPSLIFDSQRNRLKLQLD